MQLAALAAIVLSTSVAFAQQQGPEILVYSKTAGYRHDSIPTAIDALQGIADRTSLYRPTFSEDESVFTSDQLAKFKAIVFLSNSDQVLTSDGEVAFEQWLTNGGSLVGLHAATGDSSPLEEPGKSETDSLASACLFNDTAFGTAMGSWFHRHPTSES